MATYAIGDIQGCYHSFLALLSSIKFNPTYDRLWLVGDVINRGTGSLEVLRWCYEHQDHIKMVLGNHDLHAIAVAHQVKNPHRFDTLKALLNAKDAKQLLTWLRHQPLLIADQGYAMVHAGILPQWTLNQAQTYAREVEMMLQSTQYKDFLSAMYGNAPDVWDENLSGVDRLRFITNVFTRLRLCTNNGALEFNFKGELKDVPADCQPWFLMPNRQTANDNIIFGHWSALGLYCSHQVYGIDTGCLWGRRLTAFCLETKKITYVNCDLKDVPKGLS